MGFWRLPAVAGSPPYPTYKELLFVFLAYFAYHWLFFPLAAYFALGLYVGSWHPATLSALAKELQVWISCVGLWLGLPVLWAMCCRYQPNAWQCVRLSEGAASPACKFYSFLVGCATWLICFPQLFCLNYWLSMLLEYYFHSPEVDQVAVALLKQSISSPPLLTLYFVAIVTIVPLVEEFLFRGILQRWLSSMVGVPLSIVIASLLFASLHFSRSQAIYNLELLPSLFLLSCYLGFLYERQRSLWAPIGLHATFNLMNGSMLVVNALLHG
jgi:membrane protease YdiL (CAAX protease family)